MSGINPYNRPVYLLFIMLVGLMTAVSGRAVYEVGDTVLDFTLNDAYGTPVSLYDYQGMGIIIVFWTFS